MLKANSGPQVRVLSCSPVSTLPAGPPDERKLGERLRSLREEAGLTQEDLAEASGVARPQISLIESGKVDPRRSTRVALALAIERRIRRRVTEFFTAGPSEVADNSRQPMMIRDGPVPKSVADVLDFMSGLKQVTVEAEVACGEPLDYSVKGETVLIPEGDAPNELKGERLLRARGDSMVEFGIQDGDYIVAEMRQGGYPATGEIVIAWYGEGITMKRWMHVGGKKILQAGAPEYASYELKEGDVFELKAIVRRRIRIDQFPRISG